MRTKIIALAVGLCLGIVGVFCYQRYKITYKLPPAGLAKLDTNRIMCKEEHYSYEFRNSSFFYVYDSLQRQWGLLGGYTSLMRDHANLLSPVNILVINGTRQEVLRELFKDQPLLQYEYEPEKNDLIFFTNRIELFEK